MCQIESGQVSRTFGIIGKIVVALSDEKPLVSLLLEKNSFQTLPEYRVIPWSEACGC